MKFVGIEKKEQGKFITRYDVKYETVDGILKNYEMISRNGDITDFEGLHGKAADAVVIIATDENDEKILIDREYRLAPGEWVYNFPAGLIDPGETPEVSAKRELMEETGLELYEITDTIGTSSDFQMRQICVWWARREASLSRAHQLWRRSHPAGTPSLK